MESSEGSDDRSRQRRTAKEYPGITVAGCLERRSSLEVVCLRCEVMRAHEVVTAEVVGRARFLSVACKFEQLAKKSAANK